MGLFGKGFGKRSKAKQQSGGGFGGGGGLFLLCTQPAAARALLRPSARPRRPRSRPAALCPVHPAPPPPRRGAPSPDAAAPPPPPPPCGLLHTTFPRWPPLSPAVRVRVGRPIPLPLPLLRGTCTHLLLLLRVAVQHEPLGRALLGRLVDEVHLPPTRRGGSTQAHVYRYWYWYYWHMPRRTCMYCTHHTHPPQPKTPAPPRRSAPPRPRSRTAAQPMYCTCPSTPLHLTPSAPHLDVLLGLVHVAVQQAAALDAEVVGACSGEGGSGETGGRGSRV